MPRLWAGLLVLLAGCGLADYEKRMDETRERLHNFDEEAKLLGDLIQLPYKVDAEGQKQELLPFDIFLRLPKGISGSFQGEEATYRYAGQPLYRYFGDGDKNVFLAAAFKLEKGADQPGPHDVLPEDFRFRVRGGLQDYFLRTHNLNIQLPDITGVKKQTKTALRQGEKLQLEFDAIEFDDPRREFPSRLFVFYHDWKNRQSAVVYQAPKQSADNNFLKAMDVSLKTLDISMQALRLRVNFKR